MSKHPIDEAIAAQIEFGNAGLEAAMGKAIAAFLDAAQPDFEDFHGVPGRVIMALKAIALEKVT